jgi:hypothetical protein
MPEDDDWINRLVKIQREAAQARRDRDQVDAARRHVLRQASETFASDLVRAVVRLAEQYSTAADIRILVTDESGRPEADPFRFQAGRAAVKLVLQSDPSVLWHLVVNSADHVATVHRYWRDGGAASQSDNARLTFGLDAHGNVTVDGGRVEPTGLARRLLEPWLTRVRL